MGFLERSVSVRVLILSQVATVACVAFLSFGSSNVQKSLEVQNLTIRGPNSEMAIHLSAEGSLPEISMGKSAESKIVSISPDASGGGRVMVAGNGQGSAVFLQGGDGGGLYLKNPMDKMVGSWTVLKDGGSGLGLANAQGKAASILRGGVNPSITFFGSQADPMAALGVIQKVPHLLVSGKEGNEGILIHGGSPNSMVVVDERGQVKILISKQGIFQGKKEGQSKEPDKKDQKVFSMDDHEYLFPESGVAQ